MANDPKFYREEMVKMLLEKFDVKVSSYALVERRRTGYARKCVALPNSGMKIFEIVIYIGLQI